MDAELKKILGKVANTIRGLSMDAVQKANSGHPGLPMGAAELGAYLYGVALRHNPKNPKWLGRDHLVLSAGHGSMWLYACLHLAGFGVSLEDIKEFRQLHSKTPGHPEVGITPGVEATTGPLGQGIGNAVGLALAQKVLANRFPNKKAPLFNNKIFCLAGDGCLMEGVSHEASSFAGHQKLDNLILFYDANEICLDGPISECFSDDVAKRYRAYGFETYELDGYDFDAMDDLVTKLRKKQEKPALIVMRTVIGKGSPNKAGTSKAHGAPLGPDEVKLAKETLNLPQEEFVVSKAVETFFEERLKECEALEGEWNENLRVFLQSRSDLAEIFRKMEEHKVPADLEELLKEAPTKPSLSGRKSSQAVLQTLAEKLPQLIGGSADLSGSDCTMLGAYSLITASDHDGRNIKFGVREFGMSTIANGLALSGMFLPFIGTFLTFSDYMRNAIRLAALSHLQVIYQFTHDSVFLGEDGPTHQPVEHYASLRSIPNLHVFRPADEHEVRMSWLAALHYKGPSAILLTRQNLPLLEETDVSFKEGVAKGGYIVRKEKEKPDYTLFATGSELHLALDVAKELTKRGKDIRVVSMPCFELFDQQDESYRESVIGGDLGKRVSIEAGVEQGWHRYIGLDGISICMDTFGASAPQAMIAEHFGFTVDAVLEQILCES